jgi:toxin-antitoxin system PIN domain toxin
MITCDVNIFLHAMVAHSSHHALCKRELERARNSQEGFAISELVLAAVLRIGTNPRLYSPAPSTREVFQFLDELRFQQGVERIEAGERHWSIFQDLVSTTGVLGPDTADAYLAALAIEHGCQWWTTDRGFGRFPGLEWRCLLD